MLQLLVSLVQVVVYDNNVVNTRRVGVLELDLCLGQAFGDGLFGLGAAAAEALLKRLEGRGFDEDVAGVDAGSLDLFYALCTREW